jgi:hypothetical protein
MTGRKQSQPKNNPRFQDDLIGLDPDDPEAQAFASHLDRIEKCEPGFTVEASIKGVADFADSSNRLGGLKWWVAAFVVSLIMIGTAIACWDIVVRAMTWLSE